jgi:hypothetical protein
VDELIGFPRGVTADLWTGETFVCDTRGNRILIFAPDGYYRYQIPGGILFSAPRDLAVDAHGFLVVVANHQGKRSLLELDFDGRFVDVIQLSGLPEAALEPNVSSVALSPSGDRLYVLDIANLVLWMADRDGTIHGAVEMAKDLSDDQRRDLILGKVDVYGDRLLIPFSSHGHVYLFDLDGNPLGSFGRYGTAGCRLAFPVAAALDVNDDLIIVDRQRMKLVRWDPEENVCLGEHYGPGTGQGYLYYPLDLALDREGRVYVSQGLGGRVQSYEGMAPAAHRANQAGVEQAGAFGEDVVALEEGEGHPAGTAAAAVRGWARARAEGRVEDFLASYSEEFRPPDGADRDAWEAIQRDFLEGAEGSEFQLSGLEVLADSANVTLTQVPAPESGEPVAKRILVLKLEPGGWKIVEERVETIP